MAITLSRKLATLLTEKNVSVDDVVDTLRKYNLLSLLPNIVKDVKQMNKDESTWDTLLIETPFPVDVEAVAKIKNITGNNSVSYQTTINKNILAGFKARFRGTLYDGSAERIIRQFIK